MLDDPIFLSEEIYTLNDVKNYFQEKFGNDYVIEPINTDLSINTFFSARIVYFPIILLLFGFLYLFDFLNSNLENLFSITIILIFSIYIYLDLKLEKSNAKKLKLSETESIFYKERYSHYFYHHNQHFVLFITFFLSLNYFFAVIGFLIYSSGIIRMITITLKYDRIIQDTIRNVETKDGFFPYPSRFPFILPMTRKKIILSTRFYESFIENDPTLSILHPLRLYFNYFLKSLERFRILHIFIVQIAVPGGIGLIFSFYFNRNDFNNPFLTLFVAYLVFIVLETLIGYLLNKQKENSLSQKMNKMLKRYDQTEIESFIKLMKISIDPSNPRRYLALETYYLGLINYRKMSGKALEIDSKV